MSRCFIALLCLLACTPAALAQGQQGTTSLRLDAVELSKAPQGQFVFFTSFIDEYFKPKVVTDPQSWTITFDGEAREGDLKIERLQESEAGVAVVVVSAAYALFEEEIFNYARKGITRLLNSLRAVDHSAVVIYGESVENSGGLTPAHNEAVGWLAERKPGGVLVQLFEAVDKGLSFFPDGYDSIGPNRVLVIVSDGFDENDADPSRVKERMEKIQRLAGQRGVHIHVIGVAIEGDVGVEKLKKLAHYTGGTFRKAQAPNKVDTYLDHLSEALLSQHVLTLQTSDFEDNKETAFKLTVEQGGKAYNSNALMLAVPERESHLWTYVIWGASGLGGLLLLFVLVKIISAVMANRDRGEEVETGPALRTCTSCNNQIPMDWKICQYCEALPHLGRLTVGSAGELNGVTWFITESQTNIGKAEGNDIIIAHHTVSSHHAGIKVKENRFELADFASTNGVLVNGTRITKQFLRDGDMISIGAVELVFSLK